MSEEIQTINVEVVAPVMPLVLADSAFLSTLKAVDQQVMELKITDAQSNQQAADLTQRLTSAEKKLNEKRLALKRLFDPILTKIDETAKKPAERIARLKKILSDAQVAWIKYQKKLAEEADQKRLDDIARLEKLRLEEEAAAQKMADEAAAKIAAEQAALVAANPPALDVDFGDTPVDVELAATPAQAPQKTEIQRQLEAVRHAPAIVVPKAQGVRTVTTLTPVVIDVNKLPDMFVDRTAKIAAIKSTFCSGWKEGQPLPVLDGVRFDVKTEVQSTGRTGF